MQIKGIISKTVMTLMEMQDKVNLLQHNIEMLKTQNTTLNEKLLKLEFHQCRNNLVFSGQPRPIITNFLWYGDVTSMLKVKSKLPSGVYINEDSPSEWIECRKLLRPVMKEDLKLEHYKKESQVATG